MSLFLDDFERIFHKALSFAASHSTWKVSLSSGKGKCDSQQEDRQSPLEGTEV